MTINQSLVIWLGLQCCFRQGLVLRYFYYGVAEPVDHFLRPPEGEAGTIQAARNAMTYSFLHWGIHGWVLYALLGVTFRLLCFQTKLAISTSLGALPNFWRASARLGG